MARESQSPRTTDADDASIWRKLIGMVESVPGWSPPEELFSIFHLALATAPLGGDVLEIGSWCGRSAVALGWACQQAAAGHVFACDLFPKREDWWRNADGTYSFAVEVDGRRLGAYQDQTVWPEPYERDILPLYAKSEGILDLFKEAMREFGVQSIVTAVQGDSNALVARLPVETRIRVAFVDGDHGFDAVCQDIINVERFLLPGGWIAFDDAFTSYPGVDRAIKERIIENPNYEAGIQLTRKMFAARRRV